MKSELFRTIRQLIRWLGIVLVVLIIGDMFKTLGEEGVVKFNVIIDTLVNLTANIYISYAISVSAVTYGVVQSRLRKSTIKEMSKRIDYLEKGEWKQKTSSKLNIDGSTPKEDI